MEKIYCISLLWRCKSWQLCENQQWDAVVPCGYIKKAMHFVLDHILACDDVLCPDTFIVALLAIFLFFPVWMLHFCLFLLSRSSLSLSHVLPACLTICELQLCSLPYYLCYVCYLCYFCCWIEALLPIYLASLFNLLKYCLLRLPLALFPTTSTSKLSDVCSPESLDLCPCTSFFSWIRRQQITSSASCVTAGVLRTTGMSFMGHCHVHLIHITT